jgi:predicted metalloprotease with PDZ domain
VKHVFLFFSLAATLFAQKAIVYELSFDNAVHHEAEVKATFSGVSQTPLEVRMSRSSPGRYALHEFAKNVYNVRAFDGEGRPLQITRPDPYGWSISGHNGTVIVQYTLYGNRVDGTYAAIDLTHAHLNTPAALVWARGFETAPVRLHFAIPPGSNWQVASELTQDRNAWWSAPNLEQLMDSPVELSAHALPEWQIEDRHFRLALHHLGTDAEANAFAVMCKAVVLEEEGVFGAFPKYDTGAYTFLVDLLPWASGDGMEHRDSTVITDPGNLSADSAREIDTVSHEFFHSWNVRRIRPRALEPFDFDRADMSGELWFAEGFTNYYGILALQRAGLSSLDSFVSQMGHAVDAVLNAPGHKLHSAVEMSQLAPFTDAARSIDPTNFENTFISYYTYGQALALGIDLQIRHLFPGKTLDDWMRTMWREHPDIDKPYTLDDLKHTLAETTGNEAFAENVFQKHIFGREPMDYASLLSYAGLVLRKQNPGKVWLGARNLNFSDEGVALPNGTLRDSPLYLAGVDRDDRILKWDGKKFKNSGDETNWLAKHKPGDKVRLQIESRRQIREVEVLLTEDPALELVTCERAGQPLTSQAADLRKAWLSSHALHPLPSIDPMP